MNLVAMGLREANAFVALHHRHNRPVVGAKFSLGAMHGGGLVGVAIAGRPVARHLDDGSTLEALRVCTSADAPMGTGSFLYGRVRRAAAVLGYRWVVTYTLASESGATLRGAGWRAVAELPARSGWNMPGRQREAGTVDGQAKIRWEAAV